VLSTTGVVTTVATGEAKPLREVIAQREDLAVHNLRVVDAQDGRPQREPLVKQWRRTRHRCDRFGVLPGELEQLDAAVSGASPATAVAMMRLIDLCIADTGFILVIVDDAERACLPPSFVEAVQGIFARELLTEASPDIALSVQLRRPAPVRLERSLDQDLLAATLGRGDAAIPAWHSWRARASLDDTIGFGAIAPMLSENLNRLGIDDVDMGRINGTRRRAWYVNQLLTTQATTTVVGLRQEGIDPVLLGDLPAALHAAESRSIRPVRTVELCVAPDEAARAGKVLAGLGWTSGRGGPITKRRLSQRTWQRFRIDPGKALLFHWRPLPQGCSRLVDASTDDDLGRVALDGAEVATPSPTAELLRLWARTGDPHPGHQTRTVCDTADVVERCSGEIDWARLWSDCERLELVDYGVTYLRALPAHLQPLTGAPNRSFNSTSRPA
jgi:hypothetical protein